MNKLALFLIFLSLSFVSLAKELAIINASTKIRHHKSAKSKSLAALKAGDTVIVSEKVDSVWSKIEFDGKYGFVQNRFLEVIIPKKIETAPTKIVETPKTSNLRYVYFGLGGLLLICLIYIVKRKKQPQSKSSKTDSIHEKKNYSNDPEIIVKKEIPVQSKKSSKMEENIKKPNGEIPLQPSVIDVRSEGVKIPINEYGLTKYEKGVPFWSHQYVYSFSELNNASAAQKKFYNEFKKCFEAGIHLDIEGNSNYAFILFFDLINTYEKDINELEKVLLRLGEHYPKTKSYAISSLITRMKQIGDNEGAARLQLEEPKINRGTIETYSYYDEWKLGNKYKKELKLSDEEIGKLNYLSDFNNNFNSIPYCSKTQIHVFLRVVKKAEEIFKSKNTTFKEQTDAVASIEVKHYRYKSGSYNHNYFFNTFIGSVYQAIFKTIENKLRDVLFVGRKTELNWYIHTEAAIKEFQGRFELISVLIDEELKTLNPPDHESETLLNEYAKARWKSKSEDIERSFNANNIENYVANIHSLAKENSKNPSVENIYFQASKFIAKYDKVCALKFYVHYLFLDLNSDKFDNKQLTKTIQKSLFSTKEQLIDFGKIVSQLLKSKNLNEALKAVEELYKTKRKRIQLDANKIEEVKEKHSDTVKLLNDYLQDEFEDETTTISTSTSANEELKLEIKKKDGKESARFVVSFNEFQTEVVDLFMRNSYRLSNVEIEQFCKSKGLFKGQLINSINELCFDVLDDCFIEEDETDFVVNDEYFKKLLNND